MLRKPSAKRTSECSAGSECDKCPQTSLRAPHDRRGCGWQGAAHPRPISSRSLTLTLRTLRRRSGSASGSRRRHAAHLSSPTPLIVIRRRECEYRWIANINHVYMIHRMLIFMIDSSLNIRNIVRPSLFGGRRELDPPVSPAPPRGGAGAAGPPRGPPIPARPRAPAPPGPWSLARDRGIELNCEGLWFD